jgi:biopolymer transport protein ExbD
MARFKKSGSRSVPGINTGSMSDIVFMFLFFFMVITTIREVTLEVKVIPPQATEIQKLEKKSLVSFIYIGQPRKTSLGTESRIQLNNQFATVADIQSFVAAERASRDESEKNFITTSLKVDQNTRMGVVSDVKQELRKAGAFKINYSTRKKAKNSNI